MRGNPDPYQVGVQYLLEEFSTLTRTLEIIEFVAKLLDVFAPGGGMDFPDIALNAPYCLFLKFGNLPKSLL
jgi:hypothetical protein